MKNFCALLCSICMIYSCAKSSSTPKLKVDLRLLMPLNISLFQSFIGKDSAVIANQLKELYQDSLNEFDNTYIIKSIYKDDSSRRFALSFKNLGKKTISQVFLDLMYRNELTQKNIVDLTFELVDSTYKVNTKFAASRIGVGDNIHVEYTIEGAKKYYTPNVYSKNNSDFIWGQPESGSIGNFIICQTNNKHIFWTAYNY